MDAVVLSDPGQAGPWTGSSSFSGIHINSLRLLERSRSNDLPAGPVIGRPTLPFIIQSLPIRPPNAHVTNRYRQLARSSLHYAANLRPVRDRLHFTPHFLRFVASRCPLKVVFVTLYPSPHITEEAVTHLTNHFGEST
jgi:hypothetical protein